MVMTKSELIRQVAKKTQCTQDHIDKVITETFKIIRSNVKSGHPVKIAGFGTFEKGKHKSRNVKTPSVNGAVKIPAMWYPKFRPSPHFKHLIR